MMRAALALVLCVTSAAMAGHGSVGGHAMAGGSHPAPSSNGWHGYHGDGGGWHHHSGFGVGFIYAPWFWDPFFFPYAYPYYYPAYVPVPPPDDEAPDEPAASSTEEAAADPLEASYGLVRLRGVPDGASVDLDGRYWLSAARLDERWLALPRGQHTITVRSDGGRVVERQIDIQPGTNAVVQFAPDD